uniref:Zn(2)-C6 fungal-type domain-containing protein n=1 Tax=Gibberella zeae TaxID=5518 RepID=A0A4E9EDD2_GIBZA
MDVSSGGKDSYHNLIAYVSDIAASTQISWTDNYAMAGVTTHDTGSLKYTTTTPIIKVKFGDKINVDEVSFITPSPNKDAPTDGFLFINKIECSAVLYREINGELEQIYTSHGGDMPPGSSEMIIPQKKAYVWFSDDITSTTVDGRMAQAEVLEFDFDGHVRMAQHTTETMQGEGEESTASKTTNSKTRHRRAHTRSRLGCSECRNRRVKCDEQRPQCQNCINSKRTCEYPPVKIPLRERRALERAAGDVQPWQATVTWENTPRGNSKCAKQPELPNSKSLLGQLVLSSSAVNVGCSSINMPLRSQELFHYFCGNASAFSALPKDHRNNFLAYTISNPEALRSAVLMAGIHFAFNIGHLDKFEPTFLYHKIETVQQVRKLISRGDLKLLAGITKQISTLAYAELCRGDVKLAETHLSVIYALSNRLQGQQNDQCKTLDQELSDRYFLLTSTFVNGLESLIKGVACKQGLGGSVTTMELSETMNFLHNFHLTSGQFSHKNTVKAVRLIPAFFDAPHDGAQLLDIDYRPIIECLQGLDENPGPNEQYDFWLYGRASTFWTNIINAHLNSIYYEGNSSESNATTPEDSRYMTPWCALLAAVKFYVEQVVIIWRPLRREIFLHALRILQRDIAVAMQKPVSLQLPEMILWESFLGLVSIRGHEKFGDMDQEPGLRPFFEEIVRSQSKVMRLYTWEDMRGALVSILWPVSTSKDGYMSRIWKTAMADTDNSKIELL